MIRDILFTNIDYDFRRTLPVICGSYDFLSVMCNKGGSSDNSFWMSHYHFKATLNDTLFMYFCAPNEWCTFPAESLILRNVLCLFLYCVQLLRRDHCYKSLKDMCAVSDFHRIYRTRSIFSGSATVLNNWCQDLSELRGEKNSCTKWAVFVGDWAKKAWPFVTVLPRMLHVRCLDISMGFFFKVSFLFQHCARRCLFWYFNIKVSAL